MTRGVRKLTLTFGRGYALHLEVSDMANLYFHPRTRTRDNTLEVIGPREHVTYDDVASFTLGEVVQIPSEAVATTKAGRQEALTTVVDALAPNPNRRTMLFVNDKDEVVGVSPGDMT